MKKVLLYSGGLDSWLIDKLWSPDIKVFIKTGTKTNIEEQKRMPKNVVIVDLDLSIHEDKKTHFIQNRNLLFVTIASLYGDTVCLGSIKGDIHHDNNDYFTKKASSILTYLGAEVGKKINVVSPYSNQTKAELLKDYIDKGGCIKRAHRETFSCYTPLNGKEECLNCVACEGKTKAFKLNGFYKDSI